ncbi:uncharacterized protein LOC110488818 [Oncorhynchus mykiss]|uniref:RING-type domain-containing protein n=1 Tax=Oncorhynchus mykiss TaxID=8022 RepID=A0A060WG98_ONCMY|nr:uncharacterized protein LOC110488818 [Oncorhynchus mykiss]CDQ63590.1 unnamed protein product [Oncorhynchus mykiss]
MDSVLPELTCLVCLEILNDPHQFPCGHSYCLPCIHSMRRHNNYSCPECRREFTDNSDIVRNYRLANIANTFRKHQQRTEGKTVTGASETSDVSWLQLMIILLTIIALLKVYSLWKIADEDYQMQLEVHPSDLPNQVTQHDGLFLPRVIWTLLSLLLQILWLPLWVLWWFASTLLWLICLCVEFIMSCLLQVFAWLCNATCFTFNVLVYVCGIVCILNLFVDTRHGREGRPT